MGGVKCLVVKLFGKAQCKHVSSMCEERKCGVNETDVGVISLEQHTGLSRSSIRCGLLDLYRTGGLIPSYHCPGWSVACADEASWVLCIVLLDLHEAVYCQPSDAVVQHLLRPPEELPEDVDSIVWIVAMPCVHNFSAASSLLHLIC